ncbi:hypothetical protein Tco_0296239 [Tanacetum coccineum]
MANLEFSDKHNMVAYLEKSKGSEGFHEIIDFLNASHIKYALTENPTIYVSFIKQFWSIATARTRANGEVELTATIDGQAKTLTEASLRRHLNSPSTSQPPHSQPSPDAEEAAPMPHESPLQSVQFGRYEGSLSLNELTVLCTTVSKKVEEDEDALEDSSKQGRKISELDEDPNISLVQDEEMTWFQDVDAEVQEDTDIHIRTSNDTEVLLEEQEPTKLVEDQSSGEKGEKSEIGSTAGVKAKDKGKAIMTEPDPEKKKKKQLEQERLGHEEAVRLQEQIDEEGRQRIARDAEISKQLQKEINKAAQERVVAEHNQAHVIDWSDPSVIRPIFERVWDQINSFVSMDSEFESQRRLKRKGQEVQEEPAETQKTETKQVEEEIIQQRDVVDEQVEKERSKKAGGKRKKSLARKKARETLSEESAKKQKLEYDAEKEELQVYLNIVIEDEGPNVESLSPKYLIVYWKTHLITETFMYYQIIRADGSYKNYKIFSEILNDFDRQDALELYRLVKERFQTASPEGYDLLLWGDLKTMMEPNKEDDIWKTQQDWNLIS